MRHQQAIDALQEARTSAGSPGVEAYIRWRLADELGRAGVDRDTVLQMYADGEAHADAATRGDPHDFHGYFWKAANAGRWGQTKGVLNSLFKAAPMRSLLDHALAIRPQHPESFYILGQLYGALPGFPLSFGDVDRAVSTLRLAVDLQESEIAAGSRARVRHDFYTDLGEVLWKRGWDAPRRERGWQDKDRRADQTHQPTERGRYYESSARLQAESDREEAVRILRRTVATLEDLNRDQTELERADLEEARDLLAEWES